MTSPSPPDMSSLTLSPQRSQQRSNETYETYDGRTPYHYQTSPPIIPGGGQNSFNTTQGSPAVLKKGTRAGLPSVGILNTFSAYIMLTLDSNGSTMLLRRRRTTVRSHRRRTLMISPLWVARPLCRISCHPYPSNQCLATTRSSLLPSS